MFCENCKHFWKGKHTAKVKCMLGDTVSKSACESFVVKEEAEISREKKDALLLEIERISHRTRLSSIKESDDTSDCRIGFRPKRKTTVYALTEDGKRIARC